MSHDRTRTSSYVSVISTDVILATGAVPFRSFRSGPGFCVTTVICVIRLGKQHVLASSSCRAASSPARLSHRGLAKSHRLASICIDGHL
jgi:hypothetical protein